MVWRRRPKVFYTGHVVLSSDKIWYVELRRREASKLLTWTKAETVIGDGQELTGWLRGAGLPATVSFDGGAGMIRPTGKRGRFRGEGRLIVGTLKRYRPTHKTLPVRWTWEIRPND